MDETGESSQACPKCSGLSVKSIESWNISNHREVTEPPMPMWTCMERTCHRWPKESSD